MSAKLAGPEVLLAAVQAQSGLLPLLVQTLDEDWYSDVRHTACYVTQLLLQQVNQFKRGKAQWHESCVDNSMIMGLRDTFWLRNQCSFYVYIFSTCFYGYICL
jgi:hypothetical protein